jgi:hypothetical protein
MLTDFEDGALMKNLILLALCTLMVGSRGFAETSAEPIVVKNVYIQSEQGSEFRDESSYKVGFIYENGQFDEGSLKAFLVLDRTGVGQSSNGSCSNVTTNWALSLDAITNLDVICVPIEISWHSVGATIDLGVEVIPTMSFNNVNQLPLADLTGTYGGIKGGLGLLGSVSGLVAVNENGVALRASGHGVTFLSVDASVMIMHIARSNPYFQSPLSDGQLTSMSGSDTMAKSLNEMWARTIVLSK